MRDLKQQKKNKKSNRNRAKKKSEPICWRKLLRRSLRLGVATFSVAMLAVGGFFVTQLLMTSELFRIDAISVEEGTHFSKEQVVALSDIETGVNTFSLDLGLIGRKIEENPWVLRADVQRIFPRQVAISLVERRPVAIVNLGLLYYLDEQGEIFKVLGQNDSLDFPIVTGLDYAKAQKNDSHYASFLRQIVALLDDLNGRDLFDLTQVSEIHREKNGCLTLYTLEGGVKVKLGKSGFGQKLDRLERIYAELQPKLPVLDYIDLNVPEKVIVRIEKQQIGMKS